MPADDMTTPKMTRVAVRVPKATLDQINSWVDALGVRRSHFLGIALVVGSRLLLKASAVDQDVAEPCRFADDVGQSAAARSDSETAASDQDRGYGAHASIARLRAEVQALSSRLDSLLLAQGQALEKPIGNAQSEVKGQ